MAAVPDTVVRPRPAEDSSPGWPRRPRHGRSLRGRLWRWVRAHKVRSILLAFLVLLSPVFWSAGFALTNPSLGSTLPGRLAEWAREHGAGPFVVWAENVWYLHHAPPVGGKPAKGAIPVPKSSPTSLPATAPPHLAAPAPITPVASPPIAGEGQWQPAGRTVGGVPAIYETYVRPDSVHTSVVTGVAWMDTELLSATLYSGSTIPGGGPWADTAPVSPQAATSLVAAFNSGFLMSNANGGYYSEGKMVYPLRQGAASFVVYSNGTATVGQWGRDVSMSSDVVSVRQNLVLLVDHGQPVANLNAGDTTVWGYTLANKAYVWRSGIGVTANGALVYAAGPNLDIVDLADVLARAGAVRAMELDINTDWVNFTSYDPSSPGAAASASNGTTLVQGMAGGPSRYFEPWWSRDFITMSARPLTRTS